MLSFYQKTIKHEILFKGVGLHNGKKVNMKLVPAAPNHGIVFKRTDLKTKNFIPAIINNVNKTVLCTNIENEYGVPLFANFFFFITGFHGFHVFSGIVLNIIIFFNVIIGTYEKRKSYEMVEKVGLYWHFVDLVWVFVFTFFYLV